jgi:hypothetical protein
MFKGLTARRLFKSFGVKGLRPFPLVPDNAVGLSIYVLVSSDHGVCSDDTGKPVVGSHFHYWHILPSLPLVLGDVFICVDCL